ncbi:MAG TPA: DUF1552 domain-containing protein [Polyangiaceae bacterium]
MNFSRRTLLRGAGVALALPWMESLLPRNAAAAAATAPVRYMPIYMPNGAPHFWVPTGQQLTGWKLGPVLDSLAALQSKVTVLTGLENGSAFNSSGGSSVEPSHGRQPGAWLCCVDAYAIRQKLNTTQDENSISVDQVMATHANFAGSSIQSLQIGLSTVHSSCDTAGVCGNACQCSLSRSVSWKNSTQPMYKKVDPLTVFNMIAGVAMPGTGGGTTPTDMAKQQGIRKSVLDGVLDSATKTRARLSAADQRTMDQFLSSVRAAELKAMTVSMGMGGVACQLGAKPTMKTVTEDGIRQTTATYNKGDHADAMNALVVMAFQCNVTRIVTYMLEDERSEFVYDHVPRRTFNATAGTSTQTTGTCPEWHNGGQHGDPNDYGAITRWNVGKVAALATLLDGVKESNGLSILDNSVLFLGSCMETDNHACQNLPTLLIGGAGGKLKTGQFVNLGKRPMRDLHFTMMNSVFGMAQTNFGQNLTGAPIATIKEIVA